MKYILFEKSAVEYLISTRFFQTSEYTEGMNFARVIRGEDANLDIISNISFQRRDEGCYFIGKETSKTFLFIDIENSKIFENTTLEETVHVMQRIFRFSIRYWNKQGFTSSEKILTESNNAVIFPFPYSKKSLFRVVLAREPDSDRMIARGMRQALLVYRTGNEGAPNYIEATPIKNLRNAVDDIQILLNKAKEEFVTRNQTLNSVDPGQRPLEMFELDGLPNGGNSYMPFEQWSNYLTRSQRDFIYKPKNEHPMRVQGPAGTGKTLSLILKAIYLLREAEREGTECKIIFFAHSKATQYSIRNIFDSISEGRWSNSDLGKAQSMEITTLHEYCINNIGSKIEEHEILERDALDSKQLQYFSIWEAYGKVMKESYKTFKPFLSKSLITVLDGNSEAVICGLLQHEFSIMIKGKASGDPDKYKKLDSLSAGLKTETEDDRSFIWQMFSEYQNYFESVEQYDTDDIVLTAISNLDSPLWRRRRKHEGFDVLFIDETHLFNQNELMVFHYLTKSLEKHPIIFSIDISQAIGDQGLNEDDFLEIYNNGNNVYKSEYDIVFRCSPQITDLAMSITASGSNLFGNFKDPYNNAISAFTAQEENLCRKPEYILSYHEKELVHQALESAERMRNAMKCSPSEIVVISFSDSLHYEMVKITEGQKYVQLVKRGDMAAKEKAKSESSFLLSLPEYVGGLEFFGVILLGVDKARVPPVTGDDISRNYLNFSAFNKLYVSATRAKYQVLILGAKEHGESMCLDYAIEKKTLDLIK